MSFLLGPSEKWKRPWTLSCAPLAIQGFPLVWYPGHPRLQPKTPTPKLSWVIRPPRRLHPIRNRHRPDRQNCIHYQIIQSILWVSSLRLAYPTAGLRWHILALVWWRDRQTTTKRSKLAWQVQIILNQVRRFAVPGLGNNIRLGPMTILPLRRLYIERQVQPEMLNFVSTEEVVALFDMYVSI